MRSHDDKDLESKPKNDPRREPTDPPPMVVKSATGKSGALELSPLTEPPKATGGSGTLSSVPPARAPRPSSPAIRAANLLPKTPLKDLGKVDPRRESEAPQQALSSSALLPKMPLTSTPARGREKRGYQPIPREEDEAPILFEDFPAEKAKERLIESEQPPMFPDLSLPSEPPITPLRELLDPAQEAQGRREFKAPELTSRQTSDPVVEVPTLPSQPVIGSRNSEPLMDLPKAVSEPPMMDLPKAVSEPPMMDLPKAVSEPPVMDLPKAVSEPPVMDLPNAVLEPPVMDLPNAVLEPPLMDLPKAVSEPPVMDLPKAVSEPPVMDLPKAMVPRAAPLSPAGKTLSFDSSSGAASIDATREEPAIARVSSSVDKERGADADFPTAVGLKPTDSVKLEPPTFDTDAKAKLVQPQVEQALRDFVTPALSPKEPQSASVSVEAPMPRPPSAPPASEAASSGASADSSGDAPQVDDLAVPVSASPPRQAAVADAAHRDPLDSASSWAAQNDARAADPTTREVERMIGQTDWAGLARLLGPEERARTAHARFGLLYALARKELPAVPNDKFDPHVLAIRAMADLVEVHYASPIAILLGKRLLRSNPESWREKKASTGTTIAFIILALALGAVIGALLSFDLVTVNFAKLTFLFK